MRNPFLLLTPPLAGGILLSDILDLNLWTGAVVMAVALALYFYLAGGATNPLKALRRSKYHVTWVIPLFVGLGMMAENIGRPFNEPLDTLSRDVRAEIKNIATSTTGDRVTVEVGNTLAMLHSQAASVRRGDVVELPPRFTPVGSNLNYFDDSYSRQMRRKGIFYEMTLPSDSIMTVAHHSAPRYSADNLRERLEIFIESSLLRPDTKKFLITVLLGSKDYIDEDVRSLFSDAGISHLLALSGMHTAIIAALLLMILLPLNLVADHRWRYFAVIVILWGYTYLTGMAPSTVRATLMTTFCLGALIIQRRGHTSNALAAAAFVILLVAPSTIFNLGAQLSFLSVGALIAFLDPLNTVDRARHPRLHSTIGGLLTSMIAAMATWPVVSHAFGSVPLLFLPVNIIVLPLLPFYIGIALIYLFAFGAGWEISSLGWILDHGYGVLIEFCRWVSADGASVVPLQVTAGTTIGWVSALAAAAFALRGLKGKRRMSALLTSLLLGGGSLFYSVMSSGADRSPEAFILQNQLRDINIMTRNGEIDNLVTFPRRAVSQVHHAGKRVIAADALTEALDETCDYLIVASGCTEPLETILGRIKCDTLVIHPSVRKKREAEILKAAADLGLPTHSLRRDGPLRYIP